MSATLNSEMFSSYFGIVIQLAYLFLFQNIWVYCRCNILCVGCGFFFFFAKFLWVLDIHQSWLARSASLPREHVSSHKISTGLTRSVMEVSRVSLMARSSLLRSDMFYLGTGSSWLALTKLLVKALTLTQLK